MQKDYIANMAAFVVTNSVMTTGTPKSAGAPAITQEMIEAGADALIRANYLFDFSPGDATYLAEKVLRSALKSPRSESREDCSPEHRPR